MGEPSSAETGDLLRDWDARQYLHYYYGHKTVPVDETVMFRFYADALHGIGKQFESGLEIGCGPILNHAAQLAPWVKRLDMADVQQANLDEINHWVRNDSEAFDWSVYIGGENGVLDAEDGRGGSLAERVAMMRSRIHLMKGDLREPLPLGKPIQYPIVSCYYCSVWVIPNITGWYETMRKLTSLVERGGWLLLADVHATDYCMVNGRRIGCAHVTADDVRRVLDEVGFEASSIHIEVTPGTRPEESGIQGTFMAYAQRSTRTTTAS